jgi:signal transduction histidine kinase
VATKLYAILLIPVLVALAFGGLRVNEAYETWQEADDAERVAELVRASTAYAHALIDERDVTAAALLRGRSGDSVIDEARQRTDDARETFHAEVEHTPQTDSLRRRVEAVTDVEPQLEALRQRAYTERLPGVDTEEGYVAVQHPLMSFANELGLGTGNITSYGRTVYAISLAKAASSLQRAIGTHLLVAPGPGEETTALQLTAFDSYAYLENLARAEYDAAGMPADARRLTAAMAGAAESVAREAPGAPDLSTMISHISAGGTAGELSDQGVTEESWFRAATAEFDAYRAVERELVDAAVTEAGDIAATARRDMIVNAAAALGALLIAFAVAALMARSMSRNMSRLRGAALEVAEKRLPGLVEQLSRTNPGEVETRVAPMAISSKDEIGEIARAFDQVHREAVRLAADQAQLRGNVNAIFTSLSSRNQGLIERQLGLIGALETNEADPEQLENLFKLDHLATRMRRNGENLLVLAGEEPEHRWNQPVALVDVMRAAASEVEVYARIELTGVPECEIHGGVVNDLVHLLSELLENATTFSSPQTKVRVTATRLPDSRIMIEIHDKGIGLTQEDFADINKRLADPPAVDAAVSRRMGLFVVGRLAERHGIRVQLRPSGEQSGTTSLVMLPEGITHGGSAPRQPEQEYSVSRAVADESYVSEADRQAGVRTAAELGFDDSRYGGSGDTVQLQAIGRSFAPREPRDHSVPPSPFPAAPDERALGGPGFGTFPAATESPLGGPGTDAHRVGFGAPDPVVADYRPTGAALPHREERREEHWQQPEEEPVQRLREQPSPPRYPEEAGQERGPRREERSGGLTTSGLPRRVPRANLTEHATPGQVPGGPAVSRDPNDVRGRLSSLRRGVQQGRGATTGRDTQNNDQER